MAIMKKWKIVRFICMISVLFLSQNAVKAADPFGNLPGDTVLAEVMGQKVCLNDIEPALDAKNKQQESTNGTPYDIWLKQTRASKMGRYFKPLWDEYVKEKGLTVSQQEIKEFNEKMAGLAAAQKNRWERQKDNFAKELIAENLKKEKRAELQKRFDTCSRLIGNFHEPNLAYQNAHNDVAKTFILSWKINQALYQQYKGRVIFQQAGIEPLDAYRQFLEEQQSKDKFRFLNKDAENLFWDYYKSDKHTFIKDPNEIESAMTTPWWLKDKPQDDFYAEAEWGEQVNGLQIRIDGISGRRTFYQDETPVFKLDLLNTGDKRISCVPMGQFCEVELDGKWYKWNGPKAEDIFSAGTGSKTVQYEFLKIELDNNWILKEPLSQGNKSQIPAFSSGYHAIGVKFKTMDAPESPSIEIISNTIKFQITGPRPQKHPRPAGG
jgi:hypothetical protein